MSYGCLDNSADFLLTFFLGILIYLANKTRRFFRGIHFYDRDISDVQITKLTKIVFLHTKSSVFFLRHEAEFEKVEFILSILLNRPSDFEQNEPISEPPKHNLMFTVDRRKLSLGAIKADSAGAYCKWGNVKRMYFFQNDSAQVAHSATDGRYYINVRTNVNSTWSKKYVPAENIYKVTRHYRYNKNNSMSHLIAEVSEPNGKLLDHFYVLYRWQQGQDKSNEFSQSRHGNATNPFQGDTLWIIVSLFNTYRLS